MAEEKTKRYSLDKPLCQDNTEVQSAEYTDHYINGVTYRVWSAFEGKTNVADSLSRLMFRKLESGEQAALSMILSRYHSLKAFGDQEV